jgi:membrane-bound lytic murein transglycosylase B|tara:strand:- start:24231 stop:25190 length:960 start_codon:yes stop_codon:yes gene_type:complete
MRNLILASLLLTPSITFADYTSGVKFDEIYSILVNQHGFDGEYVASVLSSAEKQEKIIKSMNSPAEFTWTWKKYRKHFVESKRIYNGKRFIKKHLEVLNRAEAEFGVPKEIIVAILGVETRYGKIKGNINVIDALTTLSFDYPRRSKFFTNELISFFILTRKNNIDIFKTKGSYAGAMGYSQFIPSSYLAYAVDYDGDNKADLIHSPEDAIGSIANYLYKSGWKRDVGIILELKDAPKDYDETSLNNIRKPIRLDEGYSDIMIHTDISKTNKDGKYLLLRYDQDGKEHYYLGSQNFIAITKYNRSHFYAKAVYDLAEEF